MKQRPSKRLYFWYNTIALIVILTLGTFATALTYYKVSENTKTNLLRNVASIANAFEADTILTLSGAEDDLLNPNYISLKNSLIKIRELNPDVRFVYFLGYRGANPYFIVDSEPDTSEDYSPPGQAYEEANDVDRAVLLGESPDAIQISSDRWGTWLTALTPVYSASGDIVAVMGMDMDAHSYLNTVYAYSTIPIAATFFVLCVFAVGIFIRREERNFLEFKSELVSIASHEIRSPLTGISWLTESLLQKKGNLTDSQIEDLVTIQTKSTYLLSTVNDLLDSASVEKTKNREILKQKVYIQEIFKETIDTLSTNIREKNINVSIDPSVTPEISISGDKERLKRMFNNLLSNAIKYSKDGGSVIFGYTFKVNSHIFWLKDNGIGIPKESLKKIFRGFYRTEEAKKVTKNGTGLGLRYVSQIAEIHNAKVWCDSVLGEGSIFYVEFPKI